MTDDIDEVAVERACKGDRAVSLNRAEAAEAFRILDRRGLSATAIADVLGITQRTAVRIRTGATEQPFSRPGATVDNTRDKIATALRSEFTPVRRAADRARKALAELDTVLAEWDAKELALQRVNELEKELAEAKAALRGKPTPKPGQSEHAKARAWARANGVPVPDIGRVPTAVLDAWRQATAA